MQNRKEEGNLKKHLQFLMLSAVVLSSAQGIIESSGVVKANENAVVMGQKHSLPKVSVVLKPLPIKNAGQPFKDISRSIYKNYINEIYKIGITTGYTATTFKPENKVTRGEMAVFLWRLAGSPNYNAPFNVFNDVNAYKNQILWLSATNVTNGTGNHYDPNGKVTRGQMAAFLHRMAVAGGKTPSSGKYDPKVSDAKKHMFANDIGWLYSQGITDAPRAFNPDVTISRGEMAAFLSRFYNKFNKQSQPPIDKTSLKVKDSTLYVGEAWKAQDNFLSATDKVGKNVAFGQVKVRGKVDTSAAGTYTITYSYGGKTVTAKVTVEENEANLEKYFTFDAGTGTITSYKGSEKENLKIPEKIAGVPVREIGEKVFYGHEELVNVTVPKEVKKIGKSAFSECKKLASITLPEGLTTLSVDVFKNCPNLKAANLPKTLTKIETGVFINTGFESITLPEGVTKLDNWLFDNCANLKSVTLPKGLTIIENYVFRNSGLESVTVPEGVTNLGVDAFNNCKNLTSITLPQTLTTIGDRAFVGTGLKSIEFPKSLTKIGDFAFQNSGLESVTVPEGITTLGTSTFYGCANLKAVTLPQTLTTIGNRVFENCSSLTGTLKIPKQVKTIGSDAFKNTSLTKLDCSEFNRSALLNAPWELSEDKIIYKNENIKITISVHNYQNLEQNFPNFKLFL